MLDPRLVAFLDQRRVGFCLIGGLALSAWGVARYTADADLLTLDPGVLEASFWAAWTGDSPRIVPGEAEDPLGGVLRFPGPPPQDLILGKGKAAQVAVAGAVRHPSLPCPVATPAGLIVLKLEAGGPQDGADILALLANATSLGLPGLVQEIRDLLPGLSREARAYWERISSL